MNLYRIISLKKNELFNTMLNDNKGGTILMMTVIILSTVLTATMVASESIRKGVMAGRGQMDATKAFFVAEAGAERILWDLRKGGSDVSGCDNINKVVCFTADPGDIEQCVANESSCANTFEQSLGSAGQKYRLHFISDGLNSYASSTGSYKDVNRVVELYF